MQAQLNNGNVSANVHGSMAAGDLKTVGPATELILKTNLLL
jgi:hypothetical protein